MNGKEKKSKVKKTESAKSNPNPNFPHPHHGLIPVERKDGEEGKKGADSPSPAREKKSRTGFFAGAGEEAPIWLAARWARPRGAAARPLDGGVFTRWGARAPARGPATAPWSARSFALGCGSLLRLRKEKRESSEAKRERLNEMT